MRWNAGRKRQERVQPLPLVLATIGNLVPAFGPAQSRCDDDHKNLSEQMFPVPFYARAAQLSKILQGDCPSPLFTYFLIHAYSKLRTFICLGPGRGGKFLTDNELSATLIEELWEFDTPQ
jgi:hypothetical protein